MQPQTLIFVSALIVLFVASWLLHQRNQRLFLEQWPPIDDDEFMRRCSPGTKRKTALAVRRIVSEHSGVPYERVYPEQSFVNDLDMG
ncbi:MAG: hypothetical protein N2C14_14170 [Planctomycetales bacterium]